MGLGDFKEAIAAWNQVHGDDKSLSDREIESLCDWMDDVEAKAGNG